MNREGLEPLRRRQAEVFSIPFCVQCVSVPLPVLEPNSGDQ
jgi:hypothetical protein